MFAPDLLQRVEELLELCRTRRLKLVTAESCTGGLLSGVLTEIPGSSDVVERGFVTYSNDAKIELLGVPKAAIEQHGAVSVHVARAMASGALSQSSADIAAAVTGIAGPGGGSEHKPVGLVYIAVKRRGGEATVKRCSFGDIGRSRVRLETLNVAIEMLDSAARSDVG